MYGVTAHVRTSGALAFGLGFGKCRLRTTYGLAQREIGANRLQAGPHGVLDARRGPALAAASAFYDWLKPAQSQNCIKRPMCH